MKKGILLIAVNFLVFVILLLMLELLVRLFIPQIKIPGVDKTILKDSVYYSSRGLKPNARGIIYGYEFITNVNATWKYSKSGKNGKKILYLGDSVTMGVGVDRDSTFAGIVNNESEVVVLNPALIGYARQDYLNIVKKLIIEEKNRQDISEIRLFWCLNDIYNFYPDENTPDNRPAGFIGTIFKLFTQNFKLYYFLKDTFADRQKTYYLYDEQFYNKKNKLFNESISDLREIEGILQRYSISFSVYLMPYEYQLRKGITMPQNLLADSLRSNKIAVHNLMPFFEKSKNTDELFLYGDGIHFSEKGHRLVAGYLEKDK